MAVDSVRTRTLRTGSETMASTSREPSRALRWSTCHTPADLLERKSPSNSTTSPRRLAIPLQALDADNLQLIPGWDNWLLEQLERAVPELRRP
jgi:hypothetical protein